ncbi:hypothetical protein [Pumilibacter intestinalis]|uniref:hypothetical protein n=1 Tax=Pumilibacter intestinalis TaxID=2941511 RepID=UPI00203D2D5E|nr:hypothetical protein [Pumilibacter intestinalis]
MTNRQSIKNVLYTAALALFMLLFGLIGGRQEPSAFAEERAYTNVLADLQKDETFSVINYSEIIDPENELYGTVQVIQIAESESGELFLYTYQPSNKAKFFIATEVNMSLSETADGTSLFTLALLNSNGVFCKYRVNGVIVSNDTMRYYNISSIYRDWDKDMDGESDNGNTKNAVAFAVGKVFKTETADGDVKYSVKNVNVIQIKNPFAGYLQYWDGLHWDYINGGKYTDVHFIAFDTDLPIDTLQEADVSYYTQPYTWQTGNGYTYGNKSEMQYLPLTGEQEGGNAGDGFLGVKYTWKRIQRSEDFNKAVNLDEAASSEVSKTKWVLVFLETAYTERQIDTFGGRQITRTGTRVSEVTILRLKFVTAGKTYDLGTVSDKVTEGNNPSGGAHELGWLDLLCKWLEQVTGVPALVWKIIICALPFIIALPILATVFPIVGQVLLWIVKGIGVAFVWLCKGIWWLISLPFRGIAALIRKIRDKED